MSIDRGEQSDTWHYPNTRTEHVDNPATGEILEPRDSAHDNLRRPQVDPDTARHLARVAAQGEIPVIKKGSKIKKIVGSVLALAGVAGAGAAVYYAVSGGPNSGAAHSPEQTASNPANPGQPSVGEITTQPEKIVTDETVEYTSGSKSFTGVNDFIIENGVFTNTYLAPANEAEAKVILAKYFDGVSTAATLRTDLPPTQNDEFVGKATAKTLFTVDGANSPLADLLGETQVHNQLAAEKGMPDADTIDVVSVGYTAYDRRAKVIVGHAIVERKTTENGVTKQTQLMVNVGLADDSGAWHDQMGNVSEVTTK